MPGIRAPTAPRTCVAPWAISRAPARQQACQFSEPSQRRKRRERLQQGGDYQHQDHIGNEGAPCPPRDRGIRRAIVCGPREHLLPLLLRNASRPDPLKRKPGAVGGTPALARNGVSEPECVKARSKLDDRPDEELAEKQKDQSREVDIPDHESRREP